MSRVTSLALLVLLPLLVAIAIPHATSATPPASNSSTDALLSFLAALPQASQRLLLPSWNSSGRGGNGNSTAGPQHCAFLGVSCSVAGAVVALQLNGTGLSGDLAASAPQLCSLPELATLDLSGNNFTGSVPPALAACSAVSVLLLGRNALSGALPPELLSSRQLQKIDLNSNSLAGEIPAPSASAGGFSLLHYLDLSNNSLSGAIPPELTALPELTYLDLSKNKLSGPMPDFPAHCVLGLLNVDSNVITGELPRSLRNCGGNLTKLYVSNNKIGGPVPDFFASIPGLQKLFLSNNSFTGELPASIGELVHLEKLLVSTNRFTGPVPESICKCQSLTILWMHSNQFTGSIPAAIGNLVSLQWFTIKDNFLTGTIPPEIEKCQELAQLELHNNSISGIIPPELTKLTKLRVLSLFGNRLHGDVPAALWRMPYMEELALSYNNLTGEVPAEVTLMSNLREFILAYNNFTGEIPQALGLNTTQGLERVDLTGNRFHGAIPAGVCTGGRLAVLDLGHNQFTGAIPSEIFKCQSLWRVRLGNNLLSGSLPSDLGTNTGWSFVELSGNLFEGRIPSVFGSWRNLTVFDLSSNKFSGPIPLELGALSILGTLNLSSNMLSGPIPHELGNCKRLVRLDLQHNFLNGSIPPEILAFDSLQNLLLGGNKLGGQIPDSFTATQGLLELQLGGNSLEGPIPDSLGKLQFISKILNISNNRLSNEIPGSLGNLQMLEMLDLSNNSLSGPIPSKLSNMAALTFVNVSFNDLSGQLPEGWVKFAEHSPDMFLGNPHLCIQSENAPCSKNQSGKRTRKNIRIIVALLVSALAVLVSGLCAIHYMVKRSRRLLANRVSVRGLDTTEELPEDLTYDDILRATDNWSEKYVIGRGRHGTVYRTEFAPGRQWAAKTVDLSQFKFPIEMKILNMVKHRNIVKMEGYCIRGNFGIILSEYMPQGTLFELLHGRKPQVALEWKVRYQIALGAAEGLSYLHHDCVPMIVHRDVKSSNILMDADLVPKITDFGMGKIVDDEDADATVSVVVGTLGYIAPEHGYNTRLTEKSDVYSYGVVLLELLCRKMPVDPAFGDGVDIVAWMTSKLKRADHCSMMDSLDEEILYWPGDEQAKALDLLDLAMSCTQVAFQSRPSMREVVSSLMRIEDAYSK